MINILVGSLTVAGGISAGLQVARGVARGAGKLVNGDPRGALAEVAGGLVAPVRTACNEAFRLGFDVLVAASQIADGEGAMPAPTRCPARQTAPEPELDGVLN